MSEIDVGGDAEQRIKQVFPDATNIDLSGLTVSVAPTEYDPPVLNTKAPQQIWSESLTNCTRQIRREQVTKSFETTSSWSASLSATLKLSRSMSSAIKAIATVVLNSGFGVDISLTGSGSVSGSSKQTKTINEVTEVAPCTMVTVMVMESTALYTVGCHVPVTVTGIISLDVSNRVGWFFGSTYTIRVPYTHHYTIDGVGKVSGVDLSVNWNEYVASCPPGTPCRGLTSFEETGDGEKSDKKKHPPKKDAPDH